MNGLTFLCRENKKQYSVEYVRGTAFLSHPGSNYLFNLLLPTGSTPLRAVEHTGFTYFSEKGGFVPSNC